MLQGFAEWRASQHPGSSDEKALFLDRKGQPMCLETVRGCFQRIREAAGISRNDKAYYQPRLHDLRHTFAVNRLTAWYREGKDVQKHLSSLSTYLGHDKVSNTSVYLAMTDELLREASKRFKAYCNGEET
jgi:site-specific recombinase XerD